MERTTYEVTPPVPLPPPDPADLRVFFSERHAQNDGPGWVVFVEGTQVPRLFYKERYALKTAMKGVEP